MRAIVGVAIVAVGLGYAISACSGGTQENGFPGGSSSGSGGGSGSSGGGSGSSGGGSGSSSSGGTGSSSGNLAGDGGNLGTPEAGVFNTVYAHTDDTLYSVDPMTNAVTTIGVFVGTSDSSTDSAVTDLAVDANDDVYVNTESVVYKATLPAQNGGSVMLTKIATIGSSSKFYALAFAPVGALDPANETLVGGDSNGNLWSINTSSGAAVNLGNFGADPSISGNTYELSGDVVFYDDAMNNPTGLATIRSCPKDGSGSECKGDFLASVNMSALKTAYSSGTAATSLLGGIYGATSPTVPGAGTGYADVFGLGAWNSTVFGFTRHTGSVSPTLITINTTTGAGTMVSNAFSFTNGWSGAGVSTKVVISVPPPMAQ
jgi:hypothetical protein